MLWQLTHRPKSFEEMSSHKEVIEMLQCYSLQTVPNLIIHGINNKETIVYALANHLYGKPVALAHKSIEISINSTSLTVNYFESDEMVLLSPAEYGIRDRHVVQHIIKEIASSRSVLSLLDKKRPAFKLVVIAGAENLTRDAQAALRRTIEVHSGHVRVILITSELSKIIEPIRSRCLSIRIRPFSDTEIKNICTYVAKKEGFTASDELIDQIVANADGNCKRALVVLELAYINKVDTEIKRRKTDMTNFKLDWEKSIEEIVTNIRNARQPSQLNTIRKILYSLLTTGVPASLILYEILKSFSNISFKKYIQLLFFAVCYDERLKTGSRPIMHLEAFVASAMHIFQTTQ